MKTWKIDDLYAGAWTAAIENVGSVLGNSSVESMNDWIYVERVASQLGVQFNENGEIASEK